MDIKIAEIPDIHKLLPALLELRPHRSEDEIKKMLPQLFEQNYKIAYIGNNEIAFSILGFRITSFLFSGKTLIVDDLCTLSAYKKQGYSGKLFSWIKQHAKKLECEHICLNSGFQRKDAHRFYLNQGLFVESLHFGRKVAEL
jgi:GNAT superfamily N-acetyltransferase